MIDACRRPRLAPETLARGRVVGEGRECFQRDHPLQALVPRGVHDTHSAFTELAFDDVQTDALWDSCRGVNILPSRGVVASRIDLRQGWRGNRARQPVIERPKRSTRCRLVLFVSHTM